MCHRSGVLYRSGVCRGGVCRGGVCRGGVCRGGVCRGGACCGGECRGGMRRGGGVPWWGVLRWGAPLWGVMSEISTRTVVFAGKRQRNQALPAGNLYLKQGKPAKWVEKPISTCQKSLLKQLFLPGKGRETKPRLPGISTQNMEILGKGIESNNIIKMKRRIAYDKNNRRN